MSELTKIEELKQKARKVYSEKNLAAVYDVCCEFEDLARELLALRSLRDAGDEEVYVCLRGNNVVYQNRSGGWDSQLVYPDFCRLRDIAITRGQQLREAREEIERLKGDAERYRWLRSHSWHEPYHIFFGPGYNQLEPHHLDQAIDNEMKYPIQGEDKPQHEEGDGGYYDLLPGGLDQ